MAAKLKAEEKLITLVREKQCLYDKTRGDYKDMVKRNTWEDIGSALGVTGKSKCSLDSF